MSPPDISVIIVNYNAADLLAECLASLCTQRDLIREVVVVDNASTEATLAPLAGRFPWARWLYNDSNLGFAKANNQALAHCNAPYLLFLNPDTTVCQGALAAMLGFMEGAPAAALAGPQILTPDGRPQQSTAALYPGAQRAGRDVAGLPGAIAWILGACMIARRSAVEAAGGFDERFFLYGEEQDLCLRLRRAGWHIGFISQARVIHWGGHSERANPPIEVWRRKCRAEVLFYRKHYSPRAVARIRRANLLQAAWRIGTLKLAAWLGARAETVAPKLAKYRAVWDVYGSRDTG